MGDPLAATPSLRRHACFVGKGGVFHASIETPPACPQRSAPGSWRCLSIQHKLVVACRGRSGPGTVRRPVTGKPIVAIAVADRGDASGRVRMRRDQDDTKSTLTP